MKPTIFKSSQALLSGGVLLLLLFTSLFATAGNPGNLYDGNHQANPIAKLKECQTERLL
jgi:hypothetical protein